MLQLRPPAGGAPLTQRHLTLEGVPPWPILPASPLTLHAELLRPAHDLWLSPEDNLIVACAASEGASVSFTIPGLLDTPIPVPPLSTAPGQAPTETGGFLDTREGIFARLHWTGRRIPRRGYHQVSVPVRSLPAMQRQGQTPPATLENLPIVLQVKPAAGASGETLTHTLPGRVTLLDRPRPARIKTDNATARTAPVDGARLTPQRQNTHVTVDGLDRGWYRARLSPDETFYLAEDDLVLETPALFPQTEPASLASIHTARLGDTAACVSLLFSRQSASACPIRVDILPPAFAPEPGRATVSRLQVRIYNAHCRCDFIHYPPDQDIIRGVHWRPISETTTEVWIDLAAPLAGYDYTLEGGEWRLTVKTLPKPFNAVRLLIDPGHGGDESGALGLNGVPEKTLNLAVSLLLRDALRAEGFTHVALTRDTDRAVELPDRGRAAVNTKADIVLSIHHNALPDGRDPLTEHGVSTFYYHPFAKPLADTLLRGLSTQEGGPEALPGYGVFYDSLYMTRIRQAAAVLVELGFLTNPAEFERLIQPGFQQWQARRIAHRVKEYVSTVAG
jgi:N-acetylmuramoyl-L-alanine amidase